MSFNHKNVIGIARYSKEENGSQEEIMRKAGIENIVKIVKSGWNSDYTIQKVKELAGSYQHLCIAVTELDRLTRQPKDFEGLITFLEQNNKELTVWEVSHNNQFKITKEVYEKSIKQKIQEGYMESKAKSERAKIRAIESICLQNLKQSIAYSCLVDGQVVSAAQTSRILKKLGYNISDSTLSLWRRKYPDSKYCYWLKVSYTGFNFRIPDYKNLIQNCNNDVEKAKLETEFANIENMVVESYESLGLNSDVLNQLCNDDKAQNIVYRIGEDENMEISEDENLESKMKKMRISEDKESLLQCLFDDFIKKIIDQTQYITFISKIKHDVPKDDLLEYIKSKTIKDNGETDFEYYHYLMQQI